MPRHKPSTSSTQKLDDASQLKALSSPLRLRVFEYLLERAATAKQVAESFGMKPTRLYHHFSLLERAGLLELVETRKKRGTTEKYYRAVASRISLDEKRPADGQADAGALKAAALQTTLYELLESESAHPPGARPVVRRLKIRTTKREAERLRRRLEAWVEECLEAARPRGRVEYGITVAFYPTAVRDQEKI